MKNIFFVVTLFSILLSSSCHSIETVNSSQIVTPDCSVNCVAAVTVGQQLLIVKRNMNGVVDNIIPFNLASNASFTSSTSGNLLRDVTPKATTPTTDGGSVTTTTATYDTPTEIIVVIVVIYRNAEGEITNVTAREIRMPKVPK